MTAVTGFDAWCDGQKIPADAHGNNVAFSCLNCGGPVLATLLPHQRGSSADKATTCRVCSALYGVEASPSESRVLVHGVSRARTGRYLAGASPTHTAPENAASWSVIAAMLAAYGGADYEEFVAAVGQHEHPAGGKGFVHYCIRNGWLRRQ